MVTPQGSLTSRVVIVATDAYSGSLVCAVRRSIVRVPSFQVATAPLAARVAVQYLRAKDRVATAGRAPAQK